MRRSRFDNISDKQGSIASEKNSVEKATFIRQERKGEIYVRSQNPNPEDDRWYPIQRWLNLSEIGEDLLEATLAIMASEKQTTRTRTHSNLRYGFIEFLNEKHPSAKLTDLSNKTFCEFVRWLDEAEKGGKPRKSLGTKQPNLGALRRLVKRLSPKLTELGVDHEVPANAWAGQHIQQKKERESIPRQEFIDLLAATIGAYKTIFDEINPILDRIDQEISRLKDSREESPSTVEGICAAIIARYDGIVPEKRWMKEEDPELHQALVDFGYTRTVRIINPKINDLVPALIILQCFTHWNEQPLCCLKLAGIDRNAGVLKNKYKLSSFKGRAGKMVHRSFAQGDEVFNPCNVVDFIERWTRYVRAAAPDRIKDDLFLYVNLVKGGRIGAVRSLSQVSNAVYGPSLERKMKFFRKLGITPVGSNALRQAAAEYLRDLLNDSEQVRILLSHSSVAITDGHYRSSEAKRRDEMALAGAMALKQRHQDSAGKIDSRSHRGDRSAATPGYRCLDPFQSPITGQIHGRMCTGYGMCPACPMRAMRMDDISWGRRVQLQQRYKEAAQAMGTKRFNLRYGPAASALDAALQRLTDADLARISRLTLNPIPDLE